MLKTNDKQVKEAIKKYLEDQNEEFVIDTYEKFKQEYGFRVNRIGELNACVKWLRGLSTSVAYCTDDIATLMAEWLHDTKENQLNWIDKKGDSLYWLLLAREIVDIKNQYVVIEARDGSEWLGDTFTNKQNAIKQAKSDYNSLTNYDKKYNVIYVTKVRDYLDGNYNIYWQSK